MMTTLASDDPHTTVVVSSPKKAEKGAETPKRACSPLAGGTTRDMAAGDTRNERGWEVESGVGEAELSSLILPSTSAEAEVGGVTPVGKRFPSSSEGAQEMSKVERTRASPPDRRGCIDENTRSFPETA
jgi:hypothetical protein